MRNIFLAMTLLLTTATTATAAAAETPSAPALLRIPLIGGLYSVEAPPSWHVEESGKDLTATFSETAGAGGVLIITAPNPLAAQAAGYNRRAAEALLQSFGNGVITKEASGEHNGRPAHTVWIAFKSGEKAYLGWSRTVEFAEEGIAVQAMALSTMAAFADFMKTAEPILASYELTPAMVKENNDLLAEVGQKILDGF